MYVYSIVDYGFFLLLGEMYWNMQQPALFDSHVDQGRPSTSRGRPSQVAAQPSQVPARTQAGPGQPSPRAGQAGSSQSWPTQASPRAGPAGSGEPSQPRSQGRPQQSAGPIRLSDMRRGFVSGPIMSTADRPTRSQGGSL